MQSLSTLNPPCSYKLINVTLDVIIKFIQSSSSPLSKIKFDNDSDFNKIRFILTYADIIQYAQAAYVCFYEISKGNLNAQIDYSLIENIINNVVFNYEFVDHSFTDETYTEVSTNDPSITEMKLYLIDVLSNPFIYMKGNINDDLVFILHDYFIDANVFQDYENVSYEKFINDIISKF